MSATPADPDGFVVIDRRYLMVSNIDYYVDGAGRVYFDRGWHHDVVEHLTYLPHVTMIAPVRPLSEATGDVVPLSPAQQEQLRMIPYPRSASRLQAVMNLGTTARKLWSAIGDHEVVHSGIAGWPYPMGWLAIPMARARSKKNIIVVESAPWRAPPVATDSPLRKLRKRLEGAVFERMGRWCSSLCDISFYTQPGYRDEFPGSGPAFVTPATWINSDDVLPDERARALWDEKLRGPVRFLFAGRLVPEKGVEVLLRAVERLGDSGVAGRIDVIGEGPLREAVMHAADANAARRAPMELRYLDPVPYGAPFFSLLERYHASVVPSLTDEQPRIVFDAAARAVPVIASATNGLRPHVSDGRSGVLVPPGDADALAAALRSWATNPAPLQALGVGALAEARRNTHRAMHAHRSRLLAAHLLPRPIA
jgi:glycosyltransferase involved in cell wall biosynthesis